MILRVMVQHIYLRANLSCSLQDDRLRERFGFNTSVSQSMVLSCRFTLTQYLHCLPLGMRILLRTV